MKNVFTTDRIYSTHTTKPSALLTMRRLKATGTLAWVWHDPYAGKTRHWKVIVQPSLTSHRREQTLPTKGD